MRENHHTVTAPDGIRLFVREYIADGIPIERTLVFIHGAGEHGGRYAEFARAATDAGWRVLIPDLRGHGLSDGIRVHVREFNDYLSDLTRIYQHFSLASKQSGLIGHSMGGLLVARWIQTNPDSAAAACLLSPYIRLKIKVDRFTLVAGKVLSHLWPTFRFKSRVRSSDLSQDQEYLQERRNDLLVQRTLTARWFFSVTHTLAEVHADASKMTLPLLVLQGDQDRVTDVQATQDWFPLTGSRDRTLQIFPGRLHELLQDSNRRETMDQILNWFSERI